jgi:hypothetical protein
MWWIYYSDWTTHLYLYSDIHTTTLIYFGMARSIAIYNMVLINIFHPQVNFATCGYLQLHSVIQLILQTHSHLRRCVGTYSVLIGLQVKMNLLRSWFSIIYFNLKSRSAPNQGPQRCNVATGDSHKNKNNSGSSRTHVLLEVLKDTFTTTDVMTYDTFVWHMELYLCCILFYII